MWRRWLTSRATRRAPQNVAPGDLAHLVRRAHKPSVEDYVRARLRMWWRRDAGMLGFAGELPDLEGPSLEAVINRMIDRMRPAKARRGTAANTAVPTRSSSSAPTTKTKTRRWPGPRNRCWWSRCQPKARPRSPGSRYRTRWSNRYARTPRSNRCSSTTANTSPPVPGARHSHPRSPEPCCCATGIAGGRDANDAPACRSITSNPAAGAAATLANLAAVCTGGGTDHHTKLVPHGSWKLVGNPNQPDGLELIRHEGVH